MKILPSAISIADKNQQTINDLNEFIIFGMMDFKMSGDLLVLNCLNFKSENHGFLGVLCIDLYKHDDLVATEA